MRHSVELVCHPATVNPTVRTIRVAVDRSTSGTLELRFRLEGPPSELRIPQPAEVRMASRLWEHTCFEAFVAIEDGSAYHEFNLSPSGEWAAHAFREYREGGPFEDETLDPRIVCRTGGDYLELDARLPLDRLSRAHARAALRLGLSAVVEADDGTLSYWALRHPTARPDFHHRDAFALLLEAPKREC